MRVAQLERLMRAREPDLRNRLGQFPTPDAIASELVRHALSCLPKPPSPLKVLEPGLGSAPFSRNVCLQWPGEVRALGFEIDRELAAASRGLRSEIDVVAGDFTRAVPTATVDLVAANPPYVRHHHIEREEKRRLRQRVADELNVDVHGLAGLYVYFMLLSHRWMANEAGAVWLIPGEFAETGYGAVLRRYLAAHVTTTRVHWFDQDCFDDALVGAAAVWFINRPPPMAHEVLFTLGEVAAPSRQWRRAAADLGESKWPRSPGHDDSSDTTALTVGDLFRVRRGLATGANPFFIRPRTELRDLGCPDEFMQPVLPSPRHVGERVVADVDGWPLESGLALLDLPDDPVAIEEVPFLSRYLAEGRRQGLPDRYLLSRRKPWWKQERRRPAPILCSYMGRGNDNRPPLRFVLNESKAVATNVWLMLEPTARGQSLLDRRGAERVWEQLRALPADALRRAGRTYGGGMAKIEPRELMTVPFTRF